MTKKKYSYLISALLVLLLTSACGAPSNSGSPDNPNTEPAAANQDSQADTEAQEADQEGNEDAQANEAGQEDNMGAKAHETDPESTMQNDDAKGQPVDADKEILIIIDQTAKPITGNSFDFVVNKAPEGYALTEIQWISGKNQIKSTVQEAIEHGQNGEDGFYISGNGQYSGFIYPDEMKGEEGEVIFLFTDDQGHALTWQKKLTLK